MSRSSGSEGTTGGVPRALPLGEAMIPAIGRVHRCSVFVCLLASVLQAASPPKAREPWKPRPGDGISSNWLIAELTHRQAHGLKLQYNPNIL